MEIVSNKKQFLPYVGPRPFKNNSHDRAVFYGRDYESQEIISLILANPIVLVYSQSGSGKTSLFNTKIYPTLAEQYDFQVFPTALVRGAIPEDLDIDKIPNLYIFNTLQSLNPNSNSMALGNEDLSSFLKQYPRLSSDTDKNEDLEEPNLKLIVFDQFEDFFNIFPPNDWQKQQNDFFMQIIKALEDDPSLRIVFVMREEYVAQLDPFAYNLSGKLRARFRLESLKRDAALLAVTQPLKNTGVSFAPGVAEELVDNLTKIHVEDVFRKPIITKGEYVEPVHLQVVCQRLWNKVVSQRLTQITHDQLEDVDAALKDFYEEAVHDTAKQTKIKEQLIRDWCENKLITTTGTRSIIHQESSLTGGLSNRAVSILENKYYLIRAESRFGATWIELTHDRLIEPIKESNKKWRNQQIRSKLLRLKVMVPIVAVIAIVGISIFAYIVYEQSLLQQQKYQQSLLQQQKLVYALIDASAFLINSGNYTGAIKNLDKALVLDPNNENALTNKGRALYLSGNSNEAIKYIDKALAINPNYVPALENKGNVLFSLGDDTQGIQYINKALAIGGKSKYVNPQGELELVNKGNNLFRLGNYTQAIQSYNKALALDPKNVLALNGKGISLYYLGNYTQAIQYYDKALALDPKYVNALTNKGITLYHLGNHTQAIQYYDKALAIDPKNVKALTNKGNALDGLGNYTQAIQYYDKALAIDPKNILVLYNKGNTLDRLGNHTGAITYFDKALAINPKDADILNGKGLALAESGKYNEAIAIYNKALAIDPKNNDALVHKGKSLDGLGRHNEAIAIYNKALAIDPKNNDALKAKSVAIAAVNNQTRRSSSNQTTAAPSSAK
jgi:tetratricopeptide (TPR) repeat protein